MTPKPQPCAWASACPDRAGWAPPLHGDRRHPAGGRRPEGVPGGAPAARTARPGGSIRSPPTWNTGSPASRRPRTVPQTSPHCSTSPRASKPLSPLSLPHSKTRQRDGHRRNQAPFCPGHTPGRSSAVPAPPTGQLALFDPQAPPAPSVLEYLDAPAPPRPRRKRRRRTTAADISAWLGGATHLVVTFARASCGPDWRTSGPNSSEPTTSHIGRSGPARRTTPTSTAARSPDRRHRPKRHRPRPPYAKGECAARQLTPLWHKGVQWCHGLEIPHPCGGEDASGVPEGP